MELELSRVRSGREEFDVLRWRWRGRGGGGLERGRAAAGMLAVGTDVPRLTDTGTGCAGFAGFCRSCGLWDGFGKEQDRASTLVTLRGDIGSGYEDCC